MAGKGQLLLSGSIVLKWLEDAVQPPLAKMLYWANQPTPNWANQPTPKWGRYLWMTPSLRSILCWLPRWRMFLCFISPFPIRRHPPLSPISLIDLGPNEQRNNNSFLMGCVGYAVWGERAGIYTGWWKENSCIYKFPTFLPPTNLWLPMHSPSALTEHVSLNIARFKLFVNKNAILLTFSP